MIRLFSNALEKNSHLPIRCCACECIGVNRNKVSCYLIFWLYDFYLLSKHILFHTVGWNGEFLESENLRRKNKLLFRTQNKYTDVIQHTRKKVIERQKREGREIKYDDIIFPGCYAHSSFTFVHIKYKIQQQCERKRKTFFTFLDFFFWYRIQLKSRRCRVAKVLHYSLVNISWYIFWTLLVQLLCKYSKRLLLSRIRSECESQEKWNLIISESKNVLQLDEAEISHWEVKLKVR